MTEVTPNLPHLGNFCKYCFMGTLLYVESHFCGDDKWSLDACVGYALAHNLFDRSEMLCTKTLYNYVELGLLGIKNIDLPQKLHRRTKAKRIRERKRVLGRSIEERPESVDSLRNVRNLLIPERNSGIGRSMK